MRLKLYCLFAGYLITGLLWSDLSTRTADEKQVIEVPFSFDHNGVLLQVKINGKGPFNMLLDTGTSPSAIDLTTAREIGLKLSAAADPAKGVGTERILAYDTRLTRVEIGPFVAQDVAAGAIDLSKIEQVLGKPLHGILGYSLLKDRVVQIDYPKGIVRFYTVSPDVNAAPRANTPHRMRFPFRVIGGVPIIDEVYVNGTKVKGLFDTGASDDFSLLPTAVERLGLMAEAAVGDRVTGTGYRGSAEARAGKVKAIQIGAFSVSDPVVTLLLKGTISERDVYGLNIGNAFLKQYVVTFDYQNKRVLLERP